MQIIDVDILQITQAQIVDVDILQIVHAQCRHSTSFHELIIDALSY